MLMEREVVCGTSSPINRSDRRSCPTIEPVLLVVKLFLKKQELRISSHFFGKIGSADAKKGKKLMLFLLFFGNLFEIDYLGPDILGNLFQFEFPEMGQFNLDLAAGDGHDPEHGLLGTLSDLHPFPHIDLEHVFVTTVACSDGRRVI